MAVHQRMITEPTFIVDVSNELETKLAALRTYESQFADNETNAGVIPMMEGMARSWGMLANIPAGEPFFSLEPIALSSPDQVL
jgi:LmbE family N-acetylglucosaminyl deacetylase